MLYMLLEVDWCVKSLYPMHFSCTYLYFCDWSCCLSTVSHGVWVCVCVCVCSILSHDPFQSRQCKAPWPVHTRIRRVWFPCSGFFSAGFEMLTCTRMQSPCVRSADTCWQRSWCATLAEGVCTVPSTTADPYSVQLTDEDHPNCRSDSCNVLLSSVSV